MKTQKGFTLIEISFGLMILLLLASVVVPFIERQAFNARADVETERFAKVLRAVDARNFNDGFLFSYWDENGGIPPTNATLSWDEGNDFQELLGLYLISATNASCGDAALGWDPANEGGVPDVGAETSVENAALIPVSYTHLTLPTIYSV